MPFRTRSCPATCARSSSVTPSSSAAPAEKEIAKRTSSLETILDSSRPEGGARAARRMALHVDRDRVHRDVRRRRLDVHREGGRIAAEPLRADAKRVHGAAELGLELRP